MWKQTYAYLFLDHVTIKSLKIKSKVLQLLHVNGELKQGTFLLAPKRQPKGNSKPKVPSRQWVFNVEIVVEVFFFLFPLILILAFKLMLRFPAIRE